MQTLANLSRFAAAIALLLCASQALAAQRLALVIGNAKYPEGSLSTPEADAAATWSALRRNGFDAGLEKNLTRTDLLRALQRFSARLLAAQPDNVALLYYTGIVLQVGARNYILPVDAQPASEAEVMIQGVPLADVLAKLQPAGPASGRLVIIDAGYRNRLPFGAPGLAAEPAPPGFVLAFANSPGQAPLRSRTASYTAALTAALGVPGLTLETLLARVHAAVTHGSGGQQTPWHAGVLPASFPLAAETAAAVLPAVPVLNTTPPPAAPAPAVVPAAPLPGQASRDCPECPEMVTVPAGSFEMGARDSRKEERPVHTVRIQRPLQVGKYEITFSEWDACVAAGACAFNPPDERWGRLRRPAIYVSWDDAQQYVQWISKRSGRNYRLPTEAEWEYFARAGSTTRFPWGADVGVDHANCRGCGPASSATTLPVGSLAANAFGLHDVIGNVAEWVQDCYQEGYANAPDNGAEAQAPGCEYRITRGGSWDEAGAGIRVTQRNGGLPRLRARTVGFRVVRD